MRRRRLARLAAAARRTSRRRVGGRAAFGIARFGLARRFGKQDQRPHRRRNGRRGSGPVGGRQAGQQCQKGQKQPQESPLYTSGAWNIAPRPLNIG